MPANPSFPGRRINFSEVLYSDWMDVTGDCLLLRAECLQIDSAEINITPETRGDAGGTVYSVTATSAAMELTATGFATTVYLATASTSAGNGLLRQVRFKIEESSGQSGAYAVIRLHPPIMFDSSRAYS